jgi:hypothetical protein
VHHKVLPDGEAIIVLRPKPITAEVVARADDEDDA